MVTAVRLLVAAVLVTAGALKLGGREELSDAIGQMELLPHGWDVPAAAFLPWLEIVAGGALLTRIGRRGGALVASALGAVFLAVKIARPEAACSCLGGNGALLEESPVLPAMLAIASAYLLMRRRSSVTRREVPGVETGSRSG
jgi:hypothetical protein